MGGNFVDTLRLHFKSIPSQWQANISVLATDYGRLRVLDTQGHKPVIINVPDGPNVLEHQEHLIQALSKDFRVICFELPGSGFSYPSIRHDYSLERTARLILHLMDVLKVGRAALSFSCANGFYAIKAAEIAPDRFSHLFLAQTPSLHYMQQWVKNTIPAVLTYPLIGQLTNAVLEKKFAGSWYKWALPKGADISGYQTKALHSLSKGGCFCLSGLVQGLSKDMNASLQALTVPSTMVWGSKDFTHRSTSFASITTHLPNCEIIEFDHCGHFPELEDTPLYVRMVRERLN